MIATLVAVTITVAYGARIASILHGYHEWSYESDRAEALRMVRATSGLYLICVAAYAMLVPMPTPAAIAASVGATLCLSALGGRDFDRDPEDHPSETAAR